MGSDTETIQLASEQTDSSGKRFSYGSIHGTHQNEEGHMITESGLLHVESLLKRAKNTDQRQSKWDFVSNAVSVSLTLAASAFTLIVAAVCDNGLKMPTWLYFSLWVVFVSCGSLSVVLLLIGRAKNRDWQTFYKDYITEVLEVLSKIRKRNAGVPENNN